ncbi:hypothetical protein MMC07_003207 [Pseudocyphellaria aurata]|nr:hypothetical protein [Pseudocyphellaria aurata]
MHVPLSILLSSLLACFSTIVAAVPACVVPQIAILTLKKPFTLTALAPKSSWSVLLPTPSTTNETQPYISHTRIAQPVFRLTEGKLTTVGAKGKTFSAHFGFTIEIFPPVLKPILFGGVGIEPYTGFFAGYACDIASGKTYLRLTAGEPPVVEKLAEGQKIFARPAAFEGTSVAPSFRINEQ